MQFMEFKILHVYICMYVRYVYVMRCYDIYISNLSLVIMSGQIHDAIVNLPDASTTPCLDNCNVHNAMYRVMS